MSYEYGDKVLAIYHPTTGDPNPRPREGVVVDPGFGEGMYEVFFGTLEEYEELMRPDAFGAAHDLTGVFYPRELARKNL